MGSGFGFAETEDEAVHFPEEGADLAEGGAEGLGEGFFPGDGGGGGGDEFFEIVRFLGELGGVRGIEAILDESGGIGFERAGEFLVEELGLGDEFHIPEALPGAEGEIDGSGVGIAALILEPSGESLADFMGAVLKFLLLAVLVGGMAGGVRLLAGNEAGEGVHLEPERCGKDGEAHGILVFPYRVVGWIGEQGKHGEVHVLTVGEFVFHGILFWFSWFIVLGESDL